ncbi:group 1 glycosyl transferase [Thauera linaloolentis 47Lol = DSM 12138]|uniref:Group 1 glycosyl transferase n=2 Tax=Thauera linaloolentis TaxID=76112 RepID=N6YW90_THAL4|nr:group 1 glycosyl transferase [Thauera linaloolentis 47Lol = DSM 12138]
MHYRAPLFERLSEWNDITVIHRGPELPGIWRFSQKVVGYQKIGPFDFVESGSLTGIDILVVMQNLRLIQYWLLPLNFWRKYAFVFWGIGVSSSGGLAREKSLISRVRGFCSSFADGIGFYSAHPLPFYPQKALKKAVVVGNSVESPNSENLAYCCKDSFLFIGSLDARKGLPVLFRTFAQYLDKLPTDSGIRLLRVVGDGPLRKELENLATTLKISKSVRFEGAVTDAEVKKRFFSVAAATVSPLQAGLSVAESFSYGVPFITHRYPVSGGEYLSIKDGENGFLFEREEDLLASLLKIGADPAESARLGNNAYAFYRENLQMSQYAERFNTLLHESYRRFNK